jgi:hypothetical protein
MNLIAIRAYDLEPGQRVRLPGERRLATVVAIDDRAHPALVIFTDGPSHGCDGCDLIDAEENSEVCA